MHSQGDFEVKLPKAPLPRAEDCGTVAGNGGKMAVKEGKRTEAARRKKNRCEADETGPGHGDGESGKSTGVRLEELAITAVTGSEGIARLRELARVAFRRRSLHVASHVLEDALEGDTASVQVLIGILEPGKDQKATGAKGRGRSLAEIWAEEPPWEESREESAEVGMGGREPEE